MLRHGAALFLSAALGFLVQPMAARRLLPVLGGTPAVWTGALLFFQAVLLAGYLYAHLLSTRVALRRQAAVHALVLAAALAALGFLRPLGPPAPGAAPVPWLLAALAVDVGLPFFALSTTASLLQRWFARVDGRDPYPLYAASNLGSLAGLFAYPLALEPFLPLDRQRAVWAGGFALFVGLALLCAPRVSGTAEAPAAARAGWPDRLRWMLLAAAPSSLLMGVTQHLTLDLSPFPLLWVLPLAFYLLSFVVAYAPRLAFLRRLGRALQPLVLLPLVLLMPWEGDAPDLVLTLALPLHLAAFFATSLVCHGVLADRRPGPEGLTEYYLWIAVGGVLGGIFNALAAPFLFPLPIEYPLVLAAACLLRPSTDLAPATPLRVLRLPAAMILLAGFTLLQRWMQSQTDVDAWRLLLLAGATALLTPLVRGRGYRLTAAAGAALLMGGAGSDRGNRVLHRDRSFFGSHKVEVTDGGRRFLIHGRILHGAQEESEARRRIPLTYYHRNGPCGKLFENFALRIPGGRVGAVGLGTGTLAAYGLPGQRWTFFEIDPAMERTARRWFTYLADSPAEVDVRIGDGRRGLEACAPGEFGLLLLDAFSSDAVPTHLLTREALLLVMSRLAPGGVAAFHVSNRFLDLPRLLGGHMAREGWAGVIADEGAVDESDGRSQSTWILLARRAWDLRRFSLEEPWSLLEPEPGAPAWTDGHSSILPLLRLR